jgi:hypothetical protein
MFGGCQHIKTNGTQCGSPALRVGKFCYHHQECRPERVTVKGEDGKARKILVPLFEDAHSIRQGWRTSPTGTDVVELVFRRSGSPANLCHEGNLVFTRLSGACDSLIVAG